MTAGVSLIIPTFRRAEALSRTLDRVAAIEHDALEVVVVDDGSGDATPEVVRRVAARAPHPVRYVGQANAGAAAARNRGAAEAQGDVLHFLDDDIHVAPDHVTRHLAVHAAHERALVAGEWRFTADLREAMARTPFGRYRLRLEDGFREEAPVRSLGGTLVECAVLPAADLSLSRAVFDEIGGFDERFPAAGAEDQDLSYRAREAGCRLIRDRAIEVLHDDAHVTLESFCRREERRAATVVVLRGRYPHSAAAASYAAGNGPARPTDPLGTRVRKALKAALSRPAPLRGAAATVRLLEAARVPDPLLARAYSALAGLHIFRGYRRASGDG